MKTISISLANENRVERNLYARSGGRRGTRKLKKSGIEIPYSTVCRTDNKKKEDSGPIIPENRCSINCRPVNYC